MKNKTGGIIATIAALVLCGLPGLILSCMALVGIAYPAPANGDATTGTTILFGLICLGLMLMGITPVVAFFTLRGKSAPAQPHVAVSPAPAPAAYQAPAPAAPVPAAAPAAAVPQVSTFGMDPSTQQVYDRIMALNRPSAPYHIIDGKPKNVDLIAEWKIVDAQWYEIFAKANLTKVFRIYLKFDPTKREVRGMDEELTVSWKAGVPSLSAEASFFRGQKTSISFGTGYAFTENLAPGQVYKYKFNTNEIKKPIQEAIAASGWSYKGVAFGKL